MRKHHIIGFFLIFVFVILNPLWLSDFIRQTLLEYLVSVHKLSSKDTFDAVYILGGGQESLRAKYKRVGTLYNKGCCKKIYILGRTGITEYSNNLGRNLTNNEWSLMILEYFGVPRESIKLCRVEDGFFGTFSEAKSVSKLACEKDFNSLLLITSPHHTRRVKESFAYFLNKSSVDMKVIASEKQISGISELLYEFLKLKVYQLFLLR